MLHETMDECLLRDVTKKGMLLKKIRMNHRFWIVNIIIKIRNHIVLYLPGWLKKYGTKLHHKMNKNVFKIMQYT